jgi:hypothetical protein
MRQRQEVQEVLRCCCQPALVSSNTSGWPPPMRQQFFDLAVPLRWQPGEDVLHVAYGKFRIPAVNSWLATESLVLTKVKFVLTN